MVLNKNQEKKELKKRKLNRNSPKAGNKKVSENSNKKNIFDSTRHRIILSLTFHCTRSLDYNRDLTQTRTATASTVRTT